MNKYNTLVLSFLLLISIMASHQVKGQCTGWYLTSSTNIFQNTGGSGSFTVSTTGGSGCSYSYTCSSPAWITNISASGATISFDVNPNNTCTEQIGYIYIFDAANHLQATDTIIEYVDPSCCTNWQISPSFEYFSDGGGNSSFEVTTSTGGCGYSATSSDPTWIYNISYSGGVVYYDVSPNTTCTELVGYIYVNDGNGNQQAVYTITEYPAVSCCTDWQLSETYNAFACSGWVGSFDVTTSIGGCEYTVSKPNWITTSASGGTVSYNVDTNYSDTLRIGYIGVFDGDGTPQGVDTIVEYGGCIRVGIDEINISALSVFPNPSGGQFLISFETSGPEDIQIRIYDILGQLIKEEAEIKTTGNYSQQINLANVSKGIYILQIKAGDNILERKIEINQ